MSHIQRNTAWRSGELVCADDEESQVDGLLGLFGCPENRTSRLACEIVLSRVLKLHPKAMRLAVEAIARYLPHPESGWFPPNKSELWGYCWGRTGDWGPCEFARMMDVVQDGDFGRGSYGQHVAVILQSVYDPEGTLLGIILNGTNSARIRQNAMLCLEHFGGYRSLCAVRAYSTELRAAGLTEVVDWLLEYLWEASGAPPLERLPAPLDSKQLQLFPAFQWPRPWWLPKGVD